MLVAQQRRLKFDIGLGPPTPPDANAQLGRIKAKPVLLDHDDPVEAFLVSLGKRVGDRRKAVEPVEAGFRYFAAIEQNADERGIVWPAALAPWQVHLVSLAKAGEPEREAADKLYAELQAGGIEVLYDDRDAGPGEKLTDAELIGCPLRIVAGRRGLANGIVEASERATGAEHELPLEDAAAQALSLLDV